jgi:hypothetical protein
MMKEKVNERNRIKEDIKGGKKKKSKTQKDIAAEEHKKPNEKVLFFMGTRGYDIFLVPHQQIS